MLLMRGVVDPGGLIGSGVDIRTSNIPSAGLGLFATRFFPKSHIVTEYIGNVLTRKEALALSSYTHLIGRNGTIIDGIRIPVSGLGGGSFANGATLLRHSNAIAIECLNRIFIQAIVDIEADEEIILHYGRRGFVIACK